MTTYEFWKSMNLCTACHKEKPDHGVLCNACVEKRKKKRLAKNRRPVLWNCYHCNQPTEQSGSLCQACYRKLILPHSFQKHKQSQNIE